MDSEHLRRPTLIHQSINNRLILTVKPPPKPQAIGWGLFFAERLVRRSKPAGGNGCKSVTVQPPELARTTLRP